MSVYKDEDIKLGVATAADFYTQHSLTETFLQIWEE